LKNIAVVVTAAAVVVTGVVVYGAWRTVAEDHAAIARLASTVAAPAETTFHAADLDTLPVPVQRYFDAVFRDGQAVPAIARLEQRGELLVGEGSTRWRPFTAEERFVASPPGFVWLARVRMRSPRVPFASGFEVHVRDGYVGGVASMHAEAFGLITFADAHDSPELTAGALQRYLAEAPWFPSALLPSHGVAWAAIDDSTARATLTDHAATVSMIFRFAPNGEITRAFTEARYRATPSGYRLDAWGGRFSDYAVHGGVRIPTTAEAVWLDGSEHPYWRGHIVRAAYAARPRTVSR
jgi:hypothetical protein